MVQESTQQQQQQFVLNRWQQSTLMYISNLDFSYYDICDIFVDNQRAVVF
jgi:hypothetical protein